MGMTEKESLLNSITIKMVEDYGLNLREVKGKVQEILQNYHITISDESFAGENFETSYLMKKFYDGKSAIGMNEKTLIQYKIAVSKLEEYTHKRLADVEPEDIINFLKGYGKTVSGVTLRSKYQYLSSVYSYLFLHRYIKYNPITYVDTPKMQVVYKQPMTDCDLEKIKRACEKLDDKESVRDMAILNFFVSTGCRVSELCNIRMCDVNLEKKVCTVNGKGNKQRPVILSDKAIYRLKLYLDTREDKSDYAPLFAHIRGEETKMTRDGIRMVINKLKKESSKQ